MQYLWSDQLQLHVTLPGGFLRFPETGQAIKNFSLTEQSICCITLIEQSALGLKKLIISDRIASKLENNFFFCGGHDPKTFDFATLVSSSSEM